MDNHDHGASRGALALRALVLLVAGLVVAACGNNGGDDDSNSQKTPAAKVHAIKVEPQTVDVYAEYPGHVQGKQTAQIIGRVTGILESKNYTEGSIVHRGDLLFKIDPRPYKATVDQRRGQLAQAKASLADSTRVWNRTRRLYQSKAVSQAERDKALASYQSDKATVKTDEANLESALIDLHYTTVKAPITGVTSLRDIDLGALVNANSTKLTTITQLDPVYIRFALPEDDAFARRKALSEMGKKSTDEATREATIVLKSGQTYPHKAKIDFTQSTIDPDTGTVRLRAILKNPHNELMPGRYVRMRVRIKTLKHALAVPSDAIVTGQRTQLYIAKDGKAKAVGIKLGPDTAKGQIITQGLKPGDRVITSGLSTLKSGAPVKVKNDGGQSGGGGSSQHDSASQSGDRNASQQNS